MNIGCARGDKGVKPRRAVRVGTLTIGGGFPVVIQTMTNTDTRDVEATLRQIDRIVRAGCRLVRVALPARDAVEGFEEIVARSPIPVIADVHFHAELALAAIDAGAAKLRLNPGNIRERSKVEKILEKAKDRGVPVRIGVNMGSLPPAKVERYGRTSDAVLATLEDYIASFGEMGFEELVISVKSSSVPLTLECYRRAAALFDFPLHIGVTEAGGGTGGVIKSWVGTGLLLREGIGDTVRISLTGPPEEEIPAARRMLEAIDVEWT